MRKAPALAIALTMLAGTNGRTLADDHPGPDWMAKEQVTQNLSAEGYSYITGLEADDGHWEGKAVHNGRIVEFRADPKTGTVISEKPED